VILFWLLAIPVLGGLLSWAAGRRDSRAPRWAAAFTLGLDLVLAAVFWIGPAAGAAAKTPSWLAELDRDWVPAFGVRFHLAVDGLSFLLVALTLLLGLLAVLASWTSVAKRAGLFHFSLLWALAGIIGVFLAVDLFLFYFFWELMLVPLVFLIGIWGHENRVYAAVKFFLFTQAGGLAMLASILALYFAHGRASGVYTFDYAALLATPLGPAAAAWILSGFLLAFLIKAAAVPVHVWLPDAHAQAPTAGSVILAGLLLKTGAYGLLRFVLPFFPGILKSFLPAGRLLGAAAILYGAMLAFAQLDLKRFVAYTSVSHMGFVVLGIFSANLIAFQGVVIQMIAHGLSTGALFILAGILQDRLGTRNLDRMGGFQKSAPRLGTAALFFALASLGLPGLGSFIGEFLILLGAFRAAPLVAALASLGFIASTIYSLSLIQRVFHGPVREGPVPADLDPREAAVVGILALALLWLGLHPQPVLNTARAPLSGIAAVHSPQSQEAPLPAGPGERR
jgi:NADH-quinone oxidoreductase subunit M